MICPQCGAKTAVTHTDQKDSLIVVRRRICTACFYRFKTAETGPVDATNSTTPVPKDPDARV